MKRKIIIVVCSVLCLFFASCSDDPIPILQTKTSALLTWKAQTQDILDSLQSSMSNLQYQQTRVYSRDEVDAIIKKLKDDQSWIKTGAPFPSPTATSEFSIPEGTVWTYGTYRIEGVAQNINFQGQRQEWRIMALNTSKSYILVIPQILFKMYMNPQKNVYTSNGASLTWDNENNGESFGPDGVLCSSINMPTGIKIVSSGLNNMSLNVIPNAINSDGSEVYTDATNSLTILPNCGGTNGYGSVLISPGQMATWTLTANIDTHQIPTVVNGISGYTKYSTGPWSISVTFLTDVYTR